MAEVVDPIPSGETETPIAVEETGTDVGQLSQWTLMRMRFARNKLAMTGLIGLIIMYVLVFLGPFLASNDYMQQNKQYIYGPPTQFTFINPKGQFSLQPYIYPMTTKLDQVSYTFKFSVDKTKKIPVKFFVKGDSYTIFGFVKTNVHLFGVSNALRIYPLGADPLGRDLFARLLVGGQISMTVGLAGVIISTILGSILGTVSGYYMGAADDVMQRIIEVIMSFPTVPLWAALAAALPPISENFTALDRYFLITVVLSFIGWTGLARQLRAKVMAYRTSDFIQAALACGSNDNRIIFDHMLPNAASHIIISGAMSIPGMILGETSLSFLGLGITAPMVSWGVLLKDAQQVTVIIQHPWIMIPGIAVIITVLFFSFLGDGIRDAMDPYSI